MAKFNYCLILQHFVKIANYVNYIFKNVATYGNLGFIYSYLPKIIKNAQIIQTGKSCMIAYDLQCTKGHSFEGWFEDRKAYLDQKKKGLITCPVCNVTSVDIVPSTFAIKSGSSSSSKDLALQKAQLEKVGHEAIEFVEKNFDDVGSDFAKEALKIHYGASEPRNIRGVSTKEEEKTLEDEGIDFIKIPMPVRQETDS